MNSKASNIIADPKGLSTLSIASPISINQFILNYKNEERCITLFSDIHDGDLHSCLPLDKQPHPETNNPFKLEKIEERINALKK